MTSPVTGAAFTARYRGWALEEKLDGHRCMVIVAGGAVVAFSRPRGRADPNRRQLPAALAATLARLPEGTYDGELVVPGGKPWDVVTLGARLLFVAFDLVRLGVHDLCGRPYTDRRRALLAALVTLPPTQRLVTTVESVRPTWTAVEAIWRRGGEGAVVKRLESRYEPGRRSPEWVKVKASRSATLTVVGFEPGRSGPYSVLALVDGDGGRTTVKTLGAELRRRISAAPHRYMGRRVVITYQERTPGGTYRHGIFDHFAGDGE